MTNQQAIESEVTKVMRHDGLPAERLQRLRELANQQTTSEVDRWYIRFALPGLLAEIDYLTQRYNEMNAAIEKFVVSKAQLAQEQFERELFVGVASSKKSPAPGE